MRRIVFSAVATLAFSAFTLPAASPRPGASTQSGPSQMSVSGKLTTKVGKYFIADSATKSTFEVHGQNLQQWVGQNVRVSGQMSAGVAGQPQVITLSQIDKVGAAVGVGSGKAAAAGLKAGLSNAAVVGVAGGATAATVGTLYATDVIGGDDQPVSR